MASWYVWSGATGTGDGLSWANAKTTIGAAITAGAAGDTYYIAQDHSESAASLSVTPKGTINAWDRYLCVNRAGSVPPVSADLRTTAVIASTTTSALNWAGSSSYAYYYGLVITAGGVLSIETSTGPFAHRFERCSFTIGNGAGANVVSRMGGKAGAGNWGNQYLEWLNCTVAFGATSQGIAFSGGYFLWHGASSAVAGANIPTTLIKDTDNSNGTTAYVTLDGVDLSTLGSGKTILGATANYNGTSRLVNCKLGASVTPYATPTVNGITNELIISDSSATGYRQERCSYMGTLTQETTLVCTSVPETDGVTPISWKVVTTANNQWLYPFQTFEMAVWVDQDGTSKTLTVELMNDGTTLQNTDIWMEAVVLDQSGAPLGTIHSTGAADILAAGSNIATSTATWVTTGIASPVTQKMQLTFTPTISGYVRVIIYVAKTSKTIYINPVLTVV